MLLCLLGQYLKKRYQKPLKISSELCHDYISFFFFNSWLLDFHVLGKREMMPKPPPHYFFRLPTQRWNIWWSGQKMSKFNFLVHWIFTWHDMSHFSMSVFQLRVSPALSAGWNIFNEFVRPKNSLWTYVWTGLEMSSGQHYQWAKKRFKMLCM